MEVKLENGKLYELKNGIFVLKTSIGDIQPLLDPKEDKANKNQPNGYAGLGSDGKVLSSQLPSYVDDIVEYPNKAAFPTIGNSSTIYVDLSDNNKQYSFPGKPYIDQLVLAILKTRVPRGVKRYAMRIPDMVDQGISPVDQFKLILIDYYEP